MMGPEYFTVAAYETDEGDIYCRICGEKEKLPASASVSQATMWSAWARCDLFCDMCGKVIMSDFSDGPDVELLPHRYMLKDGRLYVQGVAETPFPDADYFTTVDEAVRWLDENKIDFESVEAV